MNITTLIENKSGGKEELNTEHGLSMYIEIDGKNILFDTGQSGKFIDNAKKLNIDLKDLDYAILSHGHYDHSGGFVRLIQEINPKIKLYVGKGFFHEKYNLHQEDYEYVGNDFDEDFLRSNHIPVEYIQENSMNITENLIAFTNFHRNEEFENSNQNMFIKEKNKYKKDLFLDEISLGIPSKEGFVLLVGCSHVGIVNILDTVIQRTNKNIHTFLGGTHLVTEEEEKINRVIQYIQEKDIQVVGACHCTGKNGETMLREQLGEKFKNNRTGNLFTIENI
ncbi:MBL fold metallo-hydrolase [Irregularibacter muris]|uniref:MBL fold metallo-hydrolase n=2 Tax=Irregularibacter muris TaxID=1796619 RepID=A0AAE3HEX4_9FIRM|nr:MBL fold metallo-hydrolase [Irregularibacter muris]